MIKLDPHITTEIDEKQQYIIRKFLKTEIRIQPDLNRLFLDEFDMVIIYNSSGLSKKSIKDLDAFTKEGGGVLWFQGEKADFSNSQDFDDILDLSLIHI